MIIAYIQQEPFLPAQVVFLSSTGFEIIAIVRPSVDGPCLLSLNHGRSIMFKTIEIHVQYTIARHDDLHDWNNREVVYLLYCQRVTLFVHKQLRAPVCLDI